MGISTRRKVVSTKGNGELIFFSGFLSSGLLALFVFALLLTPGRLY
jgi:hypothetical protein